jgi:hypothetical protein
VLDDVLAHLDAQERADRAWAYAMAQVPLALQHPDDNRPFLDGMQRVVAPPDWLAAAASPDTPALDPDTLAAVRERAGRVEAELARRRQGGNGVAS